MRVMRWLEWTWAKLRAGYLFIKPVRFAVIPLAILLWALIASNQGQDVIRSLVEVDPKDPHYGGIALFLVCTLLAALQVWYWSRQLLRDNCVAAAAKRHPKSEKWLPRLLGAAVFLIALGAFAKSPALLMISALLWVGLGSFVAYLFDSHGVPLVATFLALAIAFSVANDNHAVRTLDGDLPGRKSVDDQVPGASTAGRPPARLLQASSAAVALHERGAVTAARSLCGTRRTRHACLRRSGEDWQQC